MQWDAVAAVKHSETHAKPHSTAVARNIPVRPWKPGA